MKDKLNAYLFLLNIAMKKTLLLLFLLILLVSCSSDDDGNDIVSTNIDYYTEQLKSFDGSHWDNSKWRYDLLDGKHFKTTYITGSGNTQQTHYYNEAGLLTDENTNMEAHYTYSGQQLIAMRYNNGGEDQYRRFVAISATTYYIEVLTAAYDDPSAQVTQRYIEEFDVNDNLVVVSEDANLDGIMDAPIHFTYENGDPISTEDSNGNVHNYEYTDTIDNHYAIDEKTYGKKSFCLIFVLNYLNFSLSSGVSESTHLRQFAFNNTEYQVLSNHYVKKIYFDYVISETSHVQGTTLFYFK